MNTMAAASTRRCHRRTCEAALQALRDEENALYSLLEVFRYDPQYQWKQAEAVRARAGGGGRGDGGGG